jgi:ABC-type uncharacterized transport system permease subunit
VNNPIAVIFTGIFMAMLDIVGLQLTNLTAYNEYITAVLHGNSNNRIFCHNSVLSFSKKMD